MNILGISGGFGHDAAACLVQDGHLVAMVEEERISRVKRAPKALPVDSSSYCLAEGQLTFGDIDVVAASWDPDLARHPEELRRYGQAFLRNSASRGDWTADLKYFDHHLCHAASSQYFSGFDDAIVVVMDGHGERYSTSVGRVHDGSIKFDLQFGIGHSIGHLFEAVSDHVGLGQNGAGKLMGLAAYGTPSVELPPIQFTSDGYAVDLPDVEGLGYHDACRAVGENWSTWLQAHVGDRTVVDSRLHCTVPNQGSNMLPSRRDCDLAASVQQILGDLMVHLVTVAAARYKTRRVVLSGGVALNCAANGRLLASGAADEIFVQPAANDAGACIGAAMLADSTVRTDRSASAMEFLPYLGPSFTTADVVRVFDRLRVRYSTTSNPVRVCAEELVKGRIVGWFQGRMEAGPRALGNRSILALPSLIEHRDRTNDVKGRERWRPLSPTVLDSHAGAYLRAVRDSPFMLSAEEASEQARREIPAVVHVDGTIRPQVLFRRANERYFDLLSAVEERTGIGALLNTSMNGQGEPIVCTPIDAVRYFYGSELDTLIIEDCVLTKDIPSGRGLPQVAR